MSEWLKREGERLELFVYREATCFFRLTDLSAVGHGLIA